jgi:tetratricopeptide (TPR) repeat protein
VKGRLVEALDQWRKALRASPDYLPALNETAWLLATSPEPALRRGAEAVQWAERAVRLTGAEEPEILATLAAAYAEAGRFDKAVEVETRAADLAAKQGKTPMAEALRARVAGFAAKAPLRDPR